MVNIMDKLIEALTIIKSYMPKDVEFPLHCEHDKLYVYAGVVWSQFSKKDRDRLTSLGFYEDKEFECISSSKYGSC